MTQLLFIVLLVNLMCFALGAGPATQQQDPKCLQPMEPGPCSMKLDRFYYNSKTNKCEQFKFGGCRGNDNKFGFLKTCEDACMKSSSTTAASTSSTTTAPNAASSSNVRATTARAPTSSPSSTTKIPVNNNNKQN